MPRQTFTPATSELAKAVDRHVLGLIPGGESLTSVLESRPEEIEWFTDGCGHDLSRLSPALRRGIRRVAQYRIGQIVTAQERHEPVLGHLERSREIA